ncbi:MAG: cytochrome bd oxidase small subunit CydS [Bacillota bacterium]
MDDFTIFIAPMLTVAVSVAFMVVYALKYKDPSE